VNSAAHQALLLVNAAGEQHNATLSDRGADVFTGQVVTHCWGADGRQQVTFAVLNHTTRQQHVSGSGLTLMSGYYPMSMSPFRAIRALRACHEAISAFERSGTEALWAATAPVAAVTP
jgi:hypothetical protein